MDRAEEIKTIVKEASDMDKKPKPKGKLNKTAIGLLISIALVFVLLVVILIITDVIASSIIRMIFILVMLGIVLFILWGPRNYK